MQVVVLCGGRGERLMPLTEKRPSALLRIAGKEVIFHVLEQVKKSGADSASLAVGYRSEQMKRFLETQMYGGLSVDFSQSDKQGTASAIAYACADGEDNAMIIESSSIFDFDLKKAFEFHEKSRAICTAVTKKCSDRKGKVCVRVDEQCHISGILDEPSAQSVIFDHCLTGVYIINKRFLKEYSFAEESDFIKDILSKAIDSGEEIMSYEENGYWQRIVTVQGFLACQKHMLEHGKINQENQPKFNGASIIAPVYIGKNVTVEHGAIIENGSVIDDNAVIRSHCRISGSYVGTYSVISENSVLENSAVCSGAKLLRGVNCGEYSVIGENSFIGEEAVIEKNSRIWADRKVRRGAVISGNVTGGRGHGFEIDDEGICSFGGTVTPYLAAKFGMAAGSSLSADSFAVVGRSDKAGSEILHMALVSGLASSGLTVIDIGQCTMGQLMFSTVRSSGTIGIYTSVNLSGQFRIFEKCGVPVSRMRERLIEDNFSRNKFRSISFDKMKQPVPAFADLNFYSVYMSNILPNTLKGVNADIRTSDRKLAEISDGIFPKRNDINGEKIIFHLSADGSQTAVYTEKTGYVAWERLLCLALKIAFEKGHKVSVPYTFPTSADIMAEESNGILYRYYNCSADNSDIDARKTAMCADNLFVRDGLMLAVIICSYLSAKKVSLSDALEGIPDICSTRRYIGFDGEPSVILKKITGFRAGLNEGVVFENDNSRAIIRPLKNGNGLMIFSESCQSEQASSICDEIAEKIKKIESFDSL